MPKQRSKNKLPIFKKEFSRELSLFFCDIWNKGEQQGLGSYLGRNIKNHLFIKEPKSELTFVCYERPELDYFDRLIAQKVTKDKKFFPKVKKEFDKYWQLLEPYAKGKKIESLAELKRYYNAWLAWWPLMALIFWIPSTEAVAITGPAVIESTRLRKMTEQFSDDSEFVFVNFFKKKYPGYASVVEVLKPTEIFSLAKKPFNKKQLAIFKKRQEQGFVLLNSKLWPYSKIKQLSFIKIKVENNIITGQIAFKGKKQGRVRVIMASKDIYKMKQGEILVAPMTTPIYLPALKKAIAFVTDEGGITCHAAIVARELKKPCVIGTKIATQVLKDGDLVEVDANKGIITIKNK